MTKADFCRNVLDVSSISFDDALVDILTDHPLIEKVTCDIFVARDTWGRVKVVITPEEKHPTTNKRIMTVDDWLSIVHDRYPIIPEEYWDVSFLEHHLLWHEHLREEIYQTTMSSVPKTKYDTIKSIVHIIDNAVCVLGLWYDIMGDPHRELSDDEVRWADRGFRGY